jgi:hypothetical protein
LEELMLALGHTPMKRTAARRTSSGH